MYIREKYGPEQKLIPENALKKSDLLPKWRSKSVQSTYSQLKVTPFCNACACLTYVTILVSLIILFGLPLSGNCEPLGQEVDAISGSIFEKENGHIHPFASISTTHTDNVFNSADYVESDLKTVFSAGIGFALPGVRDIDLNVNLNTASPGGLALSRAEIEGTDRYQAYFLYNPKYETYLDNSDANYDSHTMTGAFRYNFRGGLSVEVLDRFAKASEELGETGSTDRDEYTHNLVDSRVRYEFSPKLDFGVRFAYYDLEYDRNSSAYRDRSDVTLSTDASFQILPKTSIIAELQHLNICYDQSIQSDSTELNAFAGLKWDVTAKSKGTFKLGYGTKDFDKEGDISDLILELQLRHYFTTRSNLLLAATRRTNESNYGFLPYSVTTRFYGAFAHEFNPHISWRLLLSGEMEDFESDTSDDEDMENKTYTFEPSVSYKFYKWYEARLAYRYTTRDSNYDTKPLDLNYDTNEIILSLNAVF